MIMVDDRTAFEKLRDWPRERVDELDEREQTIRQFLRGDPEGPITRRRAETNYADDLLGGPPVTFGKGPAVEATRPV
jgi:hypothetical protein